MGKRSGTRAVPLGTLFLLHQHPVPSGQASRPRPHSQLQTEPYDEVQWKLSRLLRSSSADPSSSQDTGTQRGLCSACCSGHCRPAGFAEKSKFIPDRLALSPLPSPHNSPGPQVTLHSEKQPHTHSPQLSGLQTRTSQPCRGDSQWRSAAQRLYRRLVFSRRVARVCDSDSSLTLAISRTVCRARPGWAYWQRLLGTWKTSNVPHMAVPSRPCPNTEPHPVPSPKGAHRGCPVETPLPARAGSPSRGALGEQGPTFRGLPSTGGGSALPGRERLPFSFPAPVPVLPSGSKDSAHSPWRGPEGLGALALTSS